MLSSKITQSLVSLASCSDAFKSRWYSHLLSEPEVMDVIPHGTWWPSYVYSSFYFSKWQTMILLKFFIKIWLLYQPSAPIEWFSFLISCFNGWLTYLFQLQAPVSSHKSVDCGLQFSWLQTEVDKCIIYFSIPLSLCPEVTPFHLISSTIQNDPWAFTCQGCSFSTQLQCHCWHMNVI